LNPTVAGWEQEEKGTQKNFMNKQIIYAMTGEVKAGNKNNYIKIKCYWFLYRDNRL